jgi:hypothetical protein
MIQLPLGWTRSGKPFSDPYTQSDDARFKRATDCRVSPSRGMLCAWTQQGEPMNAHATRLRRLRRCAAVDAPRFIEPLECRAMLSTTLSHGTLYLIGTAGNDVLKVASEPYTKEVLVSDNGVGSRFAKGKVTKIMINGLGGNDQMIATALTLKIPIYASGQGNDTIIGGPGNDTLLGGAGNDSINGMDGNDKIAGGAGDNWLFGGAGNDTITGGSGSGDDHLFAGAGTDRLYAGSGRETLVTVGGGRDTIYGGDANDNCWCDPASTDKEVSAYPLVHRVTSFFNGVSKELNGQKLADPALYVETDPTTGKPKATADGWRNYHANPLFSTGGPVARDIFEGDNGDCWYLAVLASVAQTNPDAIRSSLVDLGDGTYAVEIHDQNAAGVPIKTYVRVDADLPVQSWNGNKVAYARLGAQDSTWVAIMEKALAVYRDGGGNSYANIYGGWLDEAYKYLGVPWTEKYSSNFTSGNDMMAWALSEFQAGKSLTYTGSWTAGGTYANHAFMVNRVWKDLGGATWMQVFDLYDTDDTIPHTLDSQNDGYMTMSVAEAFQSLGQLCSATV